MVVDRTEVLNKTEFPDSLELGKAGERIKLYTDLLKPSITRAKLEAAKANIDYYKELFGVKEK